MPKNLAAPLIDEVKLAREAIAIARSIPPGYAALRDELKSLTQLHGIDIATRIIYQILVDANQDFIQTIDRIHPDPEPVPVKFKLLIIPALFYKERPEFGGDGKTIAEIACACGIETEILQILSKGSCADNANVISHAIEHDPAEKIVLLSMSKGGPEVRLALENKNTAAHKVRAWINVSGFMRGTPHADQLLASPLLKLRIRLVCLVFGADYKIVNELATYNPRWAQPFMLPKDLMVINLLGVPLLSHIQQRNQYNRHQRLAALGPNDGFGLIADMHVPGGFTYPLWGADHYFRTPQVSPLLYRVFGYIKSRI